jgi:Dyp-type peroxidase family
MTRQLDLADIQGNVVRAYGASFPKARHFILQINDPKAGRAFIESLFPKITTAVRWDSGEDYPGPIVQPKPKVAINLAFTFRGLYALELPTGTLARLPAEFIDGMAERAHVLGDFLGFKVPDHWDPIWREPTRIHVLVSMNAQMNPKDGTPVGELELETRALIDLCQTLGGITMLPGHGPAAALYQEASALLDVAQDGSYQPSPKEHFGFTDGFGDPVFEGQYPPELEKQNAAGGGKIEPDQSWKPLATGEFLLGHADESQEIPGAAMPLAFSRNGTFMVYRKLHQNVGGFHTYIAETAKVFAKVMGISADDAAEIIKAKMAGRWSDGVPLIVAPTLADWHAFNERKKQAIATNDAVALTAIRRSYVDFKYRDDPHGTKCPVTAHMRRVNTRDMLDPAGRSKDPKSWNGSVLNNRRRILRRGLPYGAASEGTTRDDGEHGIVFMAMCASLFRQFEFVQQQWLQYGLDLNAGNDTCPLLGNRDNNDAKFVIAADPASGKPPFICDKLPQFVETRGGEYFFIPSMNALRMMGMGTVDPT